MCIRDSLFSVFLFQDDQQRQGDDGGRCQQKDGGVVAGEDGFARHPVDHRLGLGGHLGGLKGELDQPFTGLVGVAQRSRVWEEGEGHFGQMCIRDSSNRAR